MQAELRVILEEAAVRAQALENDEGDELIPVAADTERGYRREYLVVATRPAEVNGLGMKLSDALKNMIWFRKRLVYIEEPEAVHHRLAALLESAGITGKRIHDANIVALMQHSGIHTLLTNNPGDFSPFHGIEAMTPEEFS